MVAPQSPIMPTLQQLLPGQVLPEGLAGMLVTGLSLDSRAVKPGDVFIAIPGLEQDGRDYIAQALENGAIAVLAEAEGFSFADSRVVQIANLNQQLSGVAGRFYADPSDQLMLVGITGTNGKTTCSQLLAQLFSLVKDSEWLPKNTSVGVMGTLGCGVVARGKAELQETGMTTPDAITTQSVLADYRARDIGRVVMEVSSHSLAQFRVQALAFHTAVFANLSRDHLDYHGDLVSYASAKMQLFAMPGLINAVINVDDSVGAEIATKLSPAVKLCSYSLANTNAAVYADHIILSRSGIRAHVHTPWGDGELNSQLVGRFNLQNLLAVIAAACLQSLSLDEVLKVIPQLQSVAGRMELISSADHSEGDTPQVVVDYAHTPDALKNALETLREHCEGKLWCVFGCGGDRDQGKRSLMGKTACELADVVVVTSDNPRNEDPNAIIEDICGGLAEPCKAEIVTDREKAIRFAVMSAEHKDIVLVAGKGHEAYQLMGAQRLPFSDQAQVRQALRQRGGRNGD